MNETLMGLVWKRIADLAHAKLEGGRAINKARARQQHWEEYEAACFAYYRACRESLYLYTKTPAERRKELLKIAKKARELSDLIGSSELAWTPVLYYVRTKWKAIDFPDDTPFPRIEELLIDLAADAEKTAGRPHKRQTARRLEKSPDGNIPVETFRRSYVRQMVPAMEKLFGTPCHAIVADSATVIFGIDTDTEYVKSAARERVS